jgi:hypothetical protein
MMQADKILWQGGGGVVLGLILISGINLKRVNP